MSDLPTIVLLPLLENDEQWMHQTFCVFSSKSVGTKSWFECSPEGGREVAFLVRSFRPVVHERSVTVQRHRHSGNLKESVTEWLKSSLTNWEAVLNLPFRCLDDDNDDYGDGDGVDEDDGDDGDGEVDEVDDDDDEVDEDITKWFLLFTNLCRLQELAALSI